VVLDDCSRRLSGNGQFCTYVVVPSASRAVRGLRPSLDNSCRSNGATGTPRSEILFGHTTESPLNNSLQLTMAAGGSVQDVLVARCCKLAAELEAVGRLPIVLPWNTEFIRAISRKWKVP
jgi:hypothetical protein